MSAHVCYQQRLPPLIVDPYIHRDGQQIVMNMLSCRIAIKSYTDWYNETTKFIHEKTKRISLGKFQCIYTYLIWLFLDRVHQWKWYQKFCYAHPNFSVWYGSDKIQSYTPNRLAKCGPDYYGHLSFKPSLKFIIYDSIQR